MLVQIEHKTEYSYSESVFLEPHAVRLIPREDAFQSLLKADLDVSPTPIGISKNLEQDGTQSYLLWFGDDTDKLTIASTVLVDVKERNPYEFIIHPDSGLNLPLIYPEEVRDELNIFLKSITESEQIRKYGKKLSESVQWKTIPFLTHMSEKIYKDFEYEYREIGAPLPVEETFERRKGSCRDLALLSMAICRGVGLAARFVSGYFLDQSQKNPPELHAWIEVYLPGGGWRGFDPTNGIAVQGHHIALATSASYELTAPVAGTFRGGARATMATSMNIEKREEIASTQ